MTCGFSDGFDAGFEICAAVPVATKGRRPRRISIAAKSIDLLKLPLDDVVETHILLAGSTSAQAVTYPAPVLVERAASGVTVGRSAMVAAAYADRCARGVIRGQIASVARLAVIEEPGFMEDAVRVLYLAGVL